MWNYFKWFFFTLGDVATETPTIEPFSIREESDITSGIILALAGAEGVMLKVTSSISPAAQSKGTYFLSKIYPAMKRAARPKNLPTAQPVELRSIINILIFKNKLV